MWKFILDTCYSESKLLILLDLRTHVPRSGKRKLRGAKKSCLETALHENVSSFLSIAELAKLRLKAMRAGVWFKALQRIDRVLIDLTMKVTSARGTVRSVTLARNIIAVVRKLEGLLESSFKRVIREVGLPLAQELSSTAQKWGHTSAKEWASDLSFMVFLAMMHSNDPKTFRTIHTLCIKGGNP